MFSHTVAMVLVRQMRSVVVFVLLQYVNFYFQYCNCGLIVLAVFFDTLLKLLLLELVHSINSHLSYSCLFYMPTFVSIRVSSS